MVQSELQDDFIAEAHCYCIASRSYNEPADSIIVTVAVQHGLDDGASVTYDTLHL